MKILECKNCGAKVEVIEPCNCDDCGIVCCGTAMTECAPDDISASPQDNDGNIISCADCGAKVRVITPCTCDDCGITCCDKPMK
jgi:hypothetical protein